MCRILEWGVMLALLFVWFVQPFGLPLLIVGWMGLSPHAILLAAIACVMEVSRG